MYVCRCGHCLQFMMELNGIESIRFLAAKTETEDNPIQFLLPCGMNPARLVTSRVECMSTGMFTATAPDAAHFQIPEDWTHDSFDNFELWREALRAARMAHAPYTGNHAGVALLLSSSDRSNDRRVAIGPVIESVAFNPTISPLEVAFVVLAHMGREEKRSFASMVDMIRHVYLFEILVNSGDDVAMTMSDYNGTMRDGWKKQTSALLIRVCSSLAPDKRPPDITLERCTCNADPHTDSQQTAHPSRYYEPIVYC